MNKVTRLAVGREQTKGEAHLLIKEMHGTRGTSLKNALRADGSSYVAALFAWYIYWRGYDHNMLVMKSSLVMVFMPR